MREMDCAVVVIAAVPAEHASSQIATSIFCNCFVAAASVSDIKTGKYKHEKKNKIVFTLKNLFLKLLILPEIFSIGKYLAKEFIIITVFEFRFDSN